MPVLLSIKVLNNGVKFEILCIFERCKVVCIKLDLQWDSSWQLLFVLTLWSELLLFIIRDSDVFKDSILVKWGI